MGGWTKGPWAVHPERAWIVCSELDSVGHPLPVAALAWPTNYRTEDETFANAALIAEAPAMAEALRAIDRMNDHPKWFRSELDKILAPILTRIGEA